MFIHSLIHTLLLGLGQAAELKVPTPREFINFIYGKSFYSSYLGKYLLGDFFSKFTKIFYPIFFLIYGSKLLIMVYDIFTRESILTDITKCSLYINN
jgi:hypothetical protein